MEILPDERIQLDEIYAIFRRALNAGIPVDVIQEELESAYRSHIMASREVLATAANVAH